MPLVVSEPFEMDGHMFLRGEHVEEADKIERILSSERAAFVRRLAEPTTPAREG